MLFDKFSKKIKNKINKGKKTDISMLNEDEAKGSIYAHVDDEGEKSKDNKEKPLPIMDGINMSTDVEDGSEVKNDIKNNIFPVNNDIEKETPLIFESIEEENVDFDGSQKNMDNIPKEKLTEVESMSRTLESNIEEQKDIGAKTEESNTRVDLESKELENELSKAIEKDHKESENLELSTDDEINFIEDVSIYDTEIHTQKEDKEDDVKKEKKPNKLFIIVGKFKNAPTKWLYITVGVLLVLIMLIVGGGIGISLGEKNKIESFVNGGGIYIAQPVNGQNNGNFIFVEGEQKFNGGHLRLYKVLIDRDETIFYFYENINFYNYNFLLKDENGKEYNIILSSLPNLDSENKDFGRILRMEALDKGIKSFSLNIISPSTNNATTFNFALNKKLFYPPGVYSEEVKQAEGNDSGLSIFVDSFAFSAGATSLDYHMDIKGDANNVVIIDEEPPIIFMDGAKSTLLKSGYPKEYWINDKKILGKAMFEPMRSLGNEVFIHFKNFYKKYNLQYGIWATSVMNSKNALTTLQVDNYKVCLEGMARGQNKFVLVFHTEDISDEKSTTSETNQNIVETQWVKNSANLTKNKQFGQTDKNFIYNRVSTKMNAKLVVQTKSGAHIIIEGRPKFSQIGSDVIFDLENYPEEVKNLPTEAFKLIIDDVNIKAPEYSIKITPSEENKEPKAWNKSYLEQLESSFESRLSYKSGEIPIEQITGFDSKLLTGDDFLKYYTYAGNVVKAKYWAQVVTMSFDEDKQILYAIVKEAWQGDESQRFIDFMLTHKIVVKGDLNGFVIIEDSIIQ